MPAEDLDHEELLELDPVGGVIRSPRRRRRPSGKLREHRRALVRVARDVEEPLWIIAQSLPLRKLER